MPVIGVVEPGIRAAAATTRTGRVGAIGTVGTIASGAYQQAAAAAGIELTCAACPGFVEFVEAGDVDSDQIRVLAERLLAPVRAAAIDTLVLGCTHYPLARPHDRRRDGPRRRARLERRRDRVRGAPHARRRHRTPCACPSRTTSSPPATSRRSVASGPGSSGPRSSTWRRGNGADRPRLLGLVRRAPCGGACSGYLLREGDTAIWMDCGNGTFPLLQQHIDPARPQRGRDHPRAPRPLRRHLRAARAAALRARAGRAPGVRPGRRAKQRLGGLVASWGDTFDWNAIDDGDKARVGAVDLRFSRTDHPPPTYAVEASAGGRRMIYTADTGPAWSVDAFGVRRRPRALRGVVPARQHPDRHPPLGPPGRPRGPRSPGAPAPAHPHLAPGRPGGFGRGRIRGVRRAGHARRPASRSPRSDPTTGRETMGIRKDGREPDELRPITLHARLHRARDGLGPGRDGPDPGAVHRVGRGAGPAVAARARAGAG